MPGIQTTLKKQKKNLYFQIKIFNKNFVAKGDESSL